MLNACILARNNTSKKGRFVSHVTKHQAILQCKFSPTDLDKCHDRKAILAYTLEAICVYISLYKVGAAITAMLFLRDASGC
jgi:hypothetical protein